MRGRIGTSEGLRDLGHWSKVSNFKKKRRITLETLELKSSNLALQAAEGLMLSYIRQDHPFIEGA
jgi:hypothetical protein